MRKKEWIVLIACILSVLCSTMFAFGEQCSSIRENTLRLHIHASVDETIRAEKTEISDDELARQDSNYNQKETPLQR